MGSLSDIAKINISTTSVAIKQTGFGTLLIADYHTRYSPERVRSYTTPDAMLTDGFTVNDAAYKAAQAAFAQSPQPDRIKIGRRALAPDLQVDLAPTAQNLKVYHVELTGPTGLTGTGTFTSDGTATVAEIVAGLIASINGLALGITASDPAAGTVVRLKAGTLGLWFGVKVLDLTLLAAQQTHADPGIVTDLTAIALEDSDFYGLSLTTEGKAEIVALAVWVESAKKFFVQASIDADLLTGSTSDVASTIKTAAQFRTKLIYSRDSRQFAGVAWLARVFAAAPGATTWELQRLAGVSSEAISDTQLTNLKAKNGSAVIDYGGVGLTVNSKTAAGEWMDVIRDRDWFESRLQNRIVTTLANASAALSKIPFTDAGAAVLEADVRAQLAEGINAGFLADSPAPTVVIPKVSTISVGDKALRKFKTITFGAKIAGAVHLVEITGTVTV